MPVDLFESLVRAEIEAKRGKLFNIYEAKVYLQNMLSAEEWLKVKETMNEEQIVQSAEVISVFVEFYRLAVER